MPLLKILGNSCESINIGKIAGNCTESWSSLLELINLFPGNYSKCLEDLIDRTPFAAPETEFQKHIFNGEHIQERTDPATLKGTSMHSQLCITQSLATYEEEAW